MSVFLLVPPGTIQAAVVFDLFFSRSIRFSVSTTQCAVSIPKRLAEARILSGGWRARDFRECQRERERRRLSGSLSQRDKFYLTGPLGRSANPGLHPSSGALATGRSSLSGSSRRGWKAAEEYRRPRHFASHETAGVFRNRPTLMASCSLISPSPPPRRFPPTMAPARPAMALRRGSRPHRHSIGR